MKEVIDRTGFVAAGGSLPCHWKRVLVEAQNQSASKTAQKRPSAVPGCRPEVETSRPRLESFLRGTQIQKTANLRLELLLDWLGAAGPFVKAKAGEKH